MLFRIYSCRQFFRCDSDIVSQVKSAVQVIAGDTKEARETQENFSHGCSVVSQVRSAVEAIGGNAEAALKTQKYFVNTE
jgi:hypothetical protein